MTQITTRGLIQTSPLTHHWQWIRQALDKEKLNPRFKIKKVFHLTGQTKPRASQILDNNTKDLY